MSCNSHNINLIQTKLCTDLICKSANLSTCWYNLRENIFRNSQCFDHFIRPLALFRIKKLCCRSDRILSFFLPCKEVVEKVWHQNHLVSFLKKLFSCLYKRKELECCVEIHELVSCNLIEFLFIDQFETFFDHSFCTCITVMYRVLQKSSFFVDQSKINPPCVDTDTFNLSTFLCFDQTLFNLKE